MKIIHNSVLRRGFRAAFGATRPQNAIAGQRSYFSAAVSSSPSSSLSTSNTDCFNDNGSASFASRHARLFSSDSKTVLLDILAREEQEEKDMGNTEMPAELMDLKSAIEQTWRIVEDGATTSLFHKESSHKIQVSFHCQDTVEEVIDENGEVVEEEEEVSAPVRFTVTVSKAGKSLVFACFSEYGQAKIEGISTSSLSADTIHENQGTLPKPVYQGPDYLELAEDLQESLQVFLEEECGVSSDVAAFVAMFADYREEMCYVNWLKETQSIIS